MNIVFIGICLFSCQSNEEINVKEYYFPFKTFNTPAKYTYTNSEGESDLWILSYKPISKEFTSNINLSSHSEVSVEEIKDEGALFKSYFTIENGRKLTSNILDNEVIDWKMAIGDKLAWELENTFQDGQQYIRKERELVDGNTSVIFDGKSIPAIKFKDNYSFKFIDNSGQESLNEFVQVTVYAKGIGIYSSDRTFEDGSTYFTQLIQIE